MAKKKVRKQKPAVAQYNTRHGADLGVPQEAADAFMALYKNKKLSQAQEAAQLLTDRYPESAFAWKALGTALLEEGNASAALDPLLRSYKLDEQDVLTLTSLAAAYYRQGSEQKAIGYQLQAVDLQPEYGPAQYRLAEMLQSAGQHFKALEHAKKALELGYDELRARLIVGALQYQTKYFSEALKNYHILENKFPGHPTIFNNLGNLYKDIGEYEKAERYYQKALRKNPKFAMAYSNTFFAKHYNPATTQSEIIDFATGWEKRFALPALPSVTLKKIKEKSLRVGLISSGFRIHPVGQMIATALESSRPDIHFYAYSTNDVNDHITKQIRNACKQWQQVRHLSQEATAELIQYDQIDILIDLSGHGDGSCLQAISMRPAPLCVKWVGGLVNTMGLKSIDYLLSDSIETPEGVDDQYTEKLIRLPNDYICYVPCSYAPSTTSLPAIKNHYITLGCLNNAAKISTQLLAEWALLMHQLPQSRLLLRGAQYESQDFCQRLWSEMAEHGIEQERILLEGPAKHDEFLKTYQRIDIALDTWPYSGGLTTCEAMLMGVPVITLPGPTFAGRHSATHLINAGLPELVTNSWDEYRQRVIELANDLPNLAVIRAGLRTILHYSPVCDAPRFANHFNNALRAIWVRYCEDKAPEALTFNKEGEMWFADEEKLVELPEALSEDVNEEAFEWQFDEPIIIIDNAAVLPRHPDYPKWMASGHLAVISFDPASLLNKKLEELKEFGELHHYPHALLGDGKPATLYATLDAEKGSTLKPLPVDQQPEYQREKLKVLAELPVNTVTLDSIEGLSSVDMLVLDDLHDATKILENGSKYLKDTLLIQVKVTFQPTHEHQPNLAELQHWASRNGFRFYRLHEQEYRSALPADIASGLDDSELFAASALLLPNENRLVSLTTEQCTKLAFMLHTFYELDDISYRLLNQANEVSAKDWLLQTQRKGTQRCATGKKLPQRQPLTASLGQEVAAVQQLSAALNGRTLCIIDTGHVANHGLISSWYQRISHKLDAAGCAVRWIMADEATPGKMIELASSSNNVLVGGNRYYDLTVSISGYGSSNVFQSYRHPVIGTLNDHPYASFMLERARNASASGFYFARGSLAQELIFLRPDISFIHDARLEPLPARSFDCERPHSERNIDVLVPINLFYAVNAKALHDRLLVTATDYGNDYRCLVEDVLQSFTDFSLSLLSVFRITYQRLFGNEWQVSLPWSKEDARLIRLLGELDDVIRGYARRQALTQLATLPLNIRVVVMAPEEARRPIGSLIEGGVPKSWNFIGTRSYDECKELMTQSRYVLNVSPTYHDWLHERIRDAAVAGCAIVTNSNLRTKELFSDGVNALFYDHCEMAQLYSSDPAKSEKVGFAGRHQLEESLISDEEAIEQTIAAYADYLYRFDYPETDPSAGLTPRIPMAPHMSKAERALFSAALDQANSYFEFGSGGSTVWAIKRGLTVQGVDSDAQWVGALKSKLGNKCQLTHIDIGPTGDWGYPTSNQYAERFKHYSQAILDIEQAFDLILVDGRFRVACVMTSIQHILAKAENPYASRILIHDFWNRPSYHAVLDFLEPIESAESTALLRLKADIDINVLKAVYTHYAQVAD